jgi:hypothetical protein
MRRLFALALTAVAVAAAMPATSASAAGGCTGVVDTDCTYTRCIAVDCFPYHCDVYVNALGNRNAALCL